VAANVAAGLGYLAASLVCGLTAADVTRHRNELARWYIEKLISSAERTKPRWLWLQNGWAMEGWWVHKELRERSLVWAWLPGALLFALPAVASLAWAVAEFRTGRP
jgi:hypothetical protein